jgi:transcriptional regulator with XRE-family HTH domain
MTEKEQREIFARNFRWYVDSCGKTQRVIAKELGYSYTTVNTWYRGAALPNAAKIQTIADYFGISKSNLLDDTTAPAEGVHTDVQAPEYYKDKKAAEAAQKVFSDVNYRILFDAAEGSTSENLLYAAEMLRRLKGN